MKNWLGTIMTVFTMAPACFAGDPLDDLIDQIREATLFQSADGKMSLDLDFYLTSDNWVVSQPPPGIMVTNQEYLASPRLSLLGTLNLNECISIFALGNVDRGFDPTDEAFQIRPDEYFLRVNPFDGVAKFTFGKEATSYGQWVNRHYSWDNPMVNAPLAYEWITTVKANTGKLARKTVAEDRATWVPMIWGPSYTSGGLLNGTIDLFDWAFEIKNAALSSNPDQWDLWEHQLYGDALTYSGRVGWRPATEWNLGASASIGSYVEPGAFEGWQDLHQTVAGADISWAHGALEVWSEVNWSQFEVLQGANSLAGDVSLVSYFIESKWKLAPSWWLAGRWNQQLYGDKPNSTEQWDNNVWRIDACLGWRLDRSLTVKAQYSYADEAGPIAQGQHVFDLQLVLEF